MFTLLMEFFCKLLLHAKLALMLRSFNHRLHSRIVISFLGAHLIREDQVRLCKVQGRLTLICGSNLPAINPAIFSALQNFAADNNVILMTERRFSCQTVLRERRRCWVPLAFSTLLTAGASHAGEQLEQSLQLMTSQPLSIEDHQTSESLTGLSDGEPRHIDPIVAVDGVKVNQLLSQELQQLLLEHWQPTAEDPDYLREDIKLIGQYFSSFPQAAALLKTLQGQAWALRYTRDTFETRVRGNRISVKGATVLFDTRSAAALIQHRECQQDQTLCISSPADALLHELLHVQLALGNPRKFLAQGGLNGVIYPFAHETEVIEKENRLYRTMSRVDGRLRPLRRHHTGSLVASSCATCIN